MVAKAIAEYCTRLSESTRWHQGVERRIANAPFFYARCGKVFRVRPWHQRERFRPEGDTCKACLKALEDR